MANQDRNLEKTDSDRMLKEGRKENQTADKKDEQKSGVKPVHNNDSTIAPEKDQNDVMRRHE